jgi:hypothetical protein
MFPLKFSIISRYFLIIIYDMSGVPWKPARQIAGNGNLDGHALNGRFETSATPQSFRSLRFSKRPSSAVINLLPTSDCHICFLSEKDVFQSNKKAGSAKSLGGYP